MKSAAALISEEAWFNTTDIHQRSQNLPHLDPGMGLKLGVFGFSLNQNNCDSSGVYVPVKRGEEGRFLHILYHSYLLPT